MPWAGRQAAQGGAAAGPARGSHRGARERSPGGSAGQSSGESTGKADLLFGRRQDASDLFEQSSHGPAERDTATLGGGRRGVQAALGLCRAGSKAAPQGEA